MKQKVKNILSDVEVVLESYRIGEEAYAPLIDSLIEELIQVKNELKKGVTKKFFRKEASRIQNAIQSLRYLKRRSEKMVDKRKDKVLISESELIKLVDDVGMLQVEELNINLNFKDAPGKFLSGTGKVIDALTPDTSWKNDSGTSKQVIYLYQDVITSRGRGLKIDYSHGMRDFRRPPSQPNESIFSSFTITHFFSPINLGKYIIGTYDDAPSGAPHTVRPGDPPGVGWYVDSDPKSNEIQKYDFNQMQNIEAQINGSLNIIVKGFNALFRGISDIPDDVGYKDSEYSAKQIANDIISLTRGLNVWDEDTTQQLVKIILKNISEKQAVFLTINTSEKRKLQRDSIKRLATTIIKKLVDYYVSMLQASYGELESYFKDGVVDTVDPHVSFADKNRDTASFLIGIQTTIDTLQSIEIKV